MSRCHECDKIKSREYYARNSARKADYYARNRDRVQARNARTRAGAIEIYGGVCSQCGSAGDLEFDHPDWDGIEHRKSEHHVTMLRRIVRAGAPLEDRRLRLLCRGCHHSLRRVP
jgi:hypothetical protein